MTNNGGYHANRIIKRRISIFLFERSSFINKTAIDSTDTLCFFLSIQELAFQFLDSGSDTGARMSGSLDIVSGAPISKCRELTRR